MPSIDLFPDTVLGIPFLTFVIGGVITATIFLLMIACGFFLLRDFLNEGTASKNPINEENKDVAEFHEIV